MRVVLWVAPALLLVGLVLVLRFVVRGGRHLGTPGQRATYAALRRANLATPALRAGLTPTAASRVAPHLQALLGTPGVLLADGDGVLGAVGVDEEHAKLLEPHLASVLQTGQPTILPASALACRRPAGCPLTEAVVLPLAVDGRVVGTLAALDDSAPAGLLRLGGEVARFVATQLELAELDRSRERAARAELQFLRAQISPHFVYNALTAIESYVRSDPDRARRLLVGFAEFTRASFKSHGQFTTMAEELRLVDTYLELERARFGDRFDVTLRVAPETLSVRVPSLILQPIVENAVRHGLEPRRRGRLTITVEDADAEAVVSVDDDGVGTDPTRLQRILSGTADEGSVGLRNVDERLRAVFGDDHGLVVETGIGAGTRVSLRIPKFHLATAQVS
ncbi:histidine kinase [Aciditerrimonas ferrireducens]|uniref:histidine kinase n=1 Tax=Aciditerrimonas ferrireducens TaxID=667306 RepID=UPI002002AC2C|nr:histidine kinase [Aciditerrimonas ferrireducens]MCK4176403.1 histidine kinase [Aciditerrimonas ferrireducens]